jgi:dienelactone hydrolase
MLCKQEISRLPKGTAMTKNVFGLFTVVLFIFTGCKNNLWGRFNTREINCNNNGKNIFGIAYIPLNAGAKMPAVIYSHGYGGTNSGGRIYAEALARKGIAVYCFDFCGGGNASRSDGKPTDMSVFTEKSDLEAVISMMKSQDFVDSNNLFLMGISQGGMVSAMTAAEQPHAIRGLILLYPAFLIPENVRTRYKTFAEIPDTVNFFGWLQVGRRYCEDVWNYDVYAHIAGYNKDVLLIHGDRDNIVDITYSQRALNVYQSAELKIIPGAGHGFTGREAETAISYILEYIRKRSSQ